MRSLLALAALLLASVAVAAEPSKCATDACRPGMTLDRFPSFARATRGSSLDAVWITKNAPSLIEEFGPACEIHNKCLSKLDNSYTFCDEVLGLELRKVCDREFPREKGFNDWEQCSSFVSMWVVAVETQVGDAWREAQACAAQQPVDPDQTLEVWIEPKEIPLGKKTKITVYAVDSKTRVPVYAKLKVEGKKQTFEELDPTGSVGTWYTFPFELKKIDGRLPVITAEAPNYPVVTVEYSAR